jgi:hypothetical protein
MQYIYEQVAEWAKRRPNGITRSETALKLGVGKGAALDHLERAVAHGLLVKTFTFTSGSYRGWVYLHPDYVEKALL